MYRVIYEFNPRLPDQQLQYAVMPARFRDHWVFVRQKARTTYELPAGRREKGETILETARRELWEETGAGKFSLEQICAFTVLEQGASLGADTAYGMLYLAQIQAKQDLPAATEIGENILQDELPALLSYPKIQPGLFQLADSVLHYAIRPAVPSDAPAIWRLNRLGLDYDCELAATNRHLKRILQDQASSILVAAEKTSGRLAGYIHLSDCQTGCFANLKEILAIVVDPPAQKRSLGRRLLAAGEAWARQAGAGGLLCRQSQSAARQFYQACGYTVSQEQKILKKIF